MPIEFVCNGCTNTLRVPDEHAGKHARCPQCSTVNVIPSGNQNAPPANDLFSSPNPVPPPKPPEAYPPQPQQEFASPYDSQHQANQPNYSQPVHPGYQQQPGGYPQPGYGNPYATPTTPPGSYLRPHRGASILTLGILSLFCNICLIPGIVAWSMGSSDLKEIRERRMDPSGQGICKAGMILGIIGTCLHGLVWGINILAAVAG